MSTSTLPRKKNVRRAAVDLRPFAAYGRISKRKGGDGMGATVKIEDQHAQGVDVLAGRYGEEIQVDLFRDNLSAWDPEIYREEWEALLTALASGKYRGVIALNGDRFTRQPIQTEILWEACRKGGAELWTVTQGLITDPTMLRIEGALSARESDIKSKRMKDHHRRTAEAGKPHGGRRRFGYEAGMKTQRPSEALIIRQCAARVLGGESLASVARWLVEEGVPTPQGGQWQGGNLGKMLIRPHLAGQREHLGEISPTCEWEPIITVATHEALVDLLTDPDRRTNKASNARRYLLAGLATCGTCDLPLRGRILRKGMTGRAYACASGRHCHRSVEMVDTVVTDRVIERLKESDASGALITTEAKDLAVVLAAQMKALDNRLDEYGRQHLRGEISDSTLSRQTRLLESEQVRVGAELAKARSAARKPQDVLRGMTGDDARKAWEGASLGRQRAIIDFFYEVRLHGAKTRRAPFRATDVEIIPRPQIS